MEEQNKSSKGVKWTVAIIVILLIVWAIVGTRKGNAETIKIGGAFILSGPQALIGDLQKNGAGLAVDEVNAQGGINGRKVELILEDSGSDPKTALSAYQALKLKGAKYIVADSSPVVASIRDSVVKDGNLIIAAGATTPAYFDGSNLSCRIAMTAKTFGPAFTALVAKKGYTKVVTLLPENEYGHGLSTEFTKAFEASGGKIVAAEFYDATAKGGDYRTNVTKLKAAQAQADAMIVVQVGNTVEPMLTQIKDLGWKKPIVSDYYTIQNPALKNLALAEGIDFVDYQYSRGENPNESAVTKAFKQTYASKFGSTPVFLGAGHYDVTKLIIEGIKNAGDNPQKVADYISHLQNYEAVTGTLTFNDDCEVTRTSVFRTVKDAKIIDLQ